MMYKKILFIKLMKVLEDLNPSIKEEQKRYVLYLDDKPTKFFFYKDNLPADVYEVNECILYIKEKI